LIWVLSTLLQFDRYCHPRYVARIEADAFFKCTGLTQVTLPKKLTQIAPSAFTAQPAHCFDMAAANTSFTTVDGILYSKDKLP
jgi:hypothetical protein